MKDVFGKALLTYHRNDGAEYVIERDDGRTETLNAGEYFLEYNEWPTHEKQAAMEARGRVLDVGCGAGRAALWLQQRGLEVVAIDVSPLALEVSRLRGVRDCRLMDVRKLEFPDNYFDTVMMFGNNFGIAGDVRETQKVLAALHHTTTEDGLVIASTRDPLKTNDPAHLSYHMRNRSAGRPPGLVTIRIGFQGEFDDWFELLLLGEEEMREIAARAGWSLRKTFSNTVNYSAVLEKL